MKGTSSVILIIAGCIIMKFGIPGDIFGTEEKKTEMIEIMCEGLISSVEGNTIVEEIIASPVISSKKENDNSIVIFYENGLILTTQCIYTDSRVQFKNIYVGSEELLKEKLQGLIEAEFGICSPEQITSIRNELLEKGKTEFTQEAWTHTATYSEGQLIFSATLGLEK